MLMIGAGDKLSCGTLELSKRLGGNSEPTNCHWGKSRQAELHSDMVPELTKTGPSADSRCIQPCCQQGAGQGQTWDQPTGKKPTSQPILRCLTLPCGPAMACSSACQCCGSFPCSTPCQISLQARSYLKLRALSLSVRMSTCSRRLANMSTSPWSIQPCSREATHSSLALSSTTSATCTAAEMRHRACSVKHCRVSASLSTLAQRQLSRW